MQTSINFISRHHFAGMSVRKNHLVLGFLSEARIESPRIHKTQILGPRRVGHSVKLSALADVDEQLVGWLKTAYHLQA